MGQSNRLSVELPEDALQFVRKKVSSGEFASESEVIQEGLEVLRREAEEREEWERNVLKPAHDRLLADPGSAVPLDQVKRNLETARRARRKAS